ncbi:hypothetical protein BS78_02G172900 [Paspalum vaginatum]|nr:hypothetical protein BS78_02G172900 [Paspalum vaginatum]
MLSGSRASRALLACAAASKAGEPVALRRLALMVACNVAACAEGRAAPMDAGAVASVSGILLSDDGAGGLEEWCVSLMFTMSRGSLRFRGLAWWPTRDAPASAGRRSAPCGATSATAARARRLVLWQQRRLLILQRSPPATPIRSPSVGR